MRDEQDGRRCGLGAAVHGHLEEGELRIPPPQLAPNITPADSRHSYWQNTNIPNSGILELDSGGDARYSLGGGRKVQKQETRSPRDRFVLHDGAAGCSRQALSSTSQVHSSGKGRAGFPCIQIATFRETQGRSARLPLHEAQRSVPTHSGCHGQTP